MTLWEAIKTRLISWVSPKPKLASGICECSHARCAHKKGKHQCFGTFPPHSVYNHSGEWHSCACQYFIEEDDDDDEDDDDIIPSDPSPEEIEKILSIYR